MSSILDGSFTSVGTAFNLSLPSGYTEFRMVNITDSSTATLQAAANTNVMRAAGYASSPAGVAFLNLKTNGAATLALESMIAVGGFTFFDNSAPPTFAAFPVTGVTAASPAVITTTGAPGFVVGDTITLTGLNGTMQPMNGLTYTIDAVGGANTFTITFDASNGGIGGTPATAGFARKVIVNPFSPQNVVIGPTATINSVNTLLLCMNTVPSVSQGASQYSPFQRPYQIGAKLRLYMPTGYGTSITANFITVQITGFTTQAGYALPNVLNCTILPGNPSGSAITPVGLGALVYPTGVAGFRVAQYPLVTDIAEVPTLFSEAEDNTGIRGITIGTGVQTTGKLYQWWARKGWSI